MLKPGENLYQKELMKLRWIYKMEVKFCPKCESSDLIMVAGGEIGMWECKDCSFRSSIFPEKEIQKIKEKVKNVE
jgi:Zn ribbon nucleic-acid-binding protein